MVCTFLLSTLTSSLLLLYLPSQHVCVYRNKLRSFLEFTNCYSQPPLLARLKETAFHYETAIVYGKVRTMLCTYVHTYILEPFPPSACMYVCLYVRMYVHICMYVHRWVSMTRQLGWWLMQSKIWMLQRSCVLRWLWWVLVCVCACMRACVCLCFHEYACS